MRRDFLLAIDCGGNRMTDRYARQPHGGYVVTATWAESPELIETQLIGVFVTEEDAREFVAVEEEHGACCRHFITKLALPQTSPVQPVGRW
jgi:hypothetical protein